MELNSTLIDPVRVISDLVIDTVSGGGTDLQCVEDCMSHGGTVNSCIDKCKTDAG